MTTTEVYKAIFKQYVQVVGKEKALSSEGLAEYMDIEAAAGKSDNTRRMHYFAIKYALSTFDVDVSDVPAPDVDEIDIERPIFSNDEVVKLIEASKSLGGIYSKVMVFSSIYGMRRIEMARHCLKDFDKNQQTLVVRTAKHGKPRKHLVPEELIPYLRDIKVPASHTLSRRTFPKIAEVAGVDLGDDRKSWHAIRRAVVTGLMRNGCPKDKVITFMRWKTGSMLDTYHIVDPSEDVAVFEAHPFLEAWR